MRRDLGIAAAAVLTVGFGVGVVGQGGTASAVADGTGAAGGAGIAVDHRNEQAIAKAAVHALTAHPKVARLGAGATTFDAVDTMVDANGTTHVRMTREYRGLPVIGGDLVVHQGPRAGWKGVSQTLGAPLEVAIRPTLSAAAAQRRAEAPAKATRSIRGLKAADRAPLLVVDALGATPRLAYQVVTEGRRVDGTPSRLTTTVDAVTGAVLRREEGIETVDGEGHSLYSGDVAISVTRSGNNYVLTDAAHGNGATTDMKNRSDGFLCTLLGLGCSNGTAYSSPDADFGTGSNTNRESAAVDAHYGGAMTFDYYQQTFGRAGIFGTGAGAPSRVHYGNGYVNAFWDGEKMTYGDGDGSSYGPLVSLDVAGHEMSHGVTENTANLTYSGESGGLNEATSDIFGTMVEFFAANSSDPGDYFIGEQFDLLHHEGLRRMDDPASDGSSLGCWTSSAKNVDVHYSSGIGNHFFYLLAEGSGAKVIGGRQHNSPTCNNSTVAGIGRDAAQRIWFRALTTYFTSGTTYAQARTATLNAARDLYGTNSDEYAAVGAAWSAVDVG